MSSLKPISPGQNKILESSKSPVSCKPVVDLAAIRSKNTTDNAAVLSDLELYNVKHTRLPVVQKPRMVDDDWKPRRSLKSSNEVRTKRDARSAAAGAYADMFSFEDDDKENSGIPQKKPKTPSKSRLSVSFSPKVLYSHLPALPKSISKYDRSVCLHTPATPSPKKSPKSTRPRSQSVTEEMLDNVCYSFDKKPSVRGKNTPCHQCRYQSSDQKTICRSDSCQSSKRSYCGACLRTWYGEDIKDSLKDSDWICPCCRKECLCSKCRERHGLEPLPSTIASTALMMGHESVKHFIEAKLS